MQPKRSPLLLATAALGVLALGGLAYVFLGNSSSAPQPKAVASVAGPTPTAAPTIRWVAAQDIPPRTRITPAMLRRANVVGDVPKDAIKDPKDVQNELTNDTIPAGGTVTLAAFTPDIKRVIPANIEVPTGFRAVAIYVDPVSTAASLVDVGDSVDVIAVHKLSIDKEKNQFVQGALQFSAGRLIGTDLKVLAVEKSINAPVPTPTPTEGAAPAPTSVPSASAPGANANQPIPKIRVILAAPVDIATRLVAAQDQGTLHITIRNPVDSDQTLSPEAREYPSHTVTQRDVNASARQIGKAMGDGMKSSLGSRRLSRLNDEPPLPDMTMSGIKPGGPLPGGENSIYNNMPQSAPMPLPKIGDGTSGGNSAMPMPETHDITVIRGTEKTRVIVPSR